MGSDLHRPLGQDIKGRRKSRGGLFRRVGGIATVMTITAASLYVSVSPLPLQDPPVSVSQVSNPVDVAARGSTSTTPSQPPSGIATARPDSAANVTRQTMPDGSVVTTYSPRPRDGGGPVLIDAQRIGQDPRAATMPNELLLEDSSYGRLPTVGPDGLRPVEQYARPWSGARGTRIAIVIGGLGLSQTGTQYAIRELPEEVTLGFASTGNSLQRWMQEARRAGHEIILQVPMEPFDYPANNPGRGTLLSSNSEKQNLANLREAMALITNYTGVMNYMGGRFLSDADAIEPVMREITNRGLLFLDDGTSASSLAGEFAKALSTPHAFVDLQIDQQIDEASILKRLDDAERIARRNGFAVVLGSAFEETVRAVAKWSDEARLRGIELVGVSAIALENQP
ncbi:divergent polysaccharide deacetylase family protein [Ciceribacter sp. L1K22]|uniref:divergent polysaccharide deacetylase family protein n=1 Tax=Ciceribacter sp. L1K22 TaxID=2820275 RepID=UPI001ABE4380|nr:divergent polysaccharide deacetylase family protein [Ciceribacter sp. L1K22]MBO3758169.1 divergent polysaccharide deacetylase family protein [Ciceribacter sp. L1K22]